MPDNASTLAHPLDDADADTLRAAARALPTTIALCARAVADGLDLPRDGRTALGSPAAFGSLDRTAVTPMSGLTTNGATTGITPGRSPGCTARRDGTRPRKLRQWQRSRRCSGREVP